METRVRCTKTADDRFILGKTYVLSNGRGLIDERGFEGITVENGSYSEWYENCNWSDYDFEQVTNARHEIHITCTDNKTTHAVKKVDGKIAARSMAVCCSVDEFDFAVGAQLAFNRLVYGTDYNPAEVALKPERKQEPVKLYCAKGEKGFFTRGKIYEFSNGGIPCDDGWVCTGLGGYKDFADFEALNEVLHGCLVPLVSRPAKVGEWVYVDDNARGTASLHIGKVVKIASINHYGMPCFALEGSPHYNANLMAGEYLVLDGYKPEPEKAESEYYNGKVVCVDSAGYCHTVGKTYTVTDGFLIDDSGMKVPYLTGPVTSVDDLNSRSACKFAVLLDE